ISYATIIKEHAIVRDLINVAHEIVDASYYPHGRSSSDLLDLAESLIFQISENRTNTNNSLKNIENILEHTVNKIEQLYKKPNSSITGISSGYKDLDIKTAGLQKSELIIIAARPSMGKTTFAINLCENIAMLEDKPVLIFSLEMPGEQIMIRMLASLSRVEQSKIRTGQLNDHDWTRISK
ncbi:MAG: replicative DNA helicase, partial [Candidatus Lightella neohaematopini]|nr:replicative DNA helicase [Candidatus Lightella neohaematopini]